MNMPGFLSDTKTDTIHKRKVSDMTNTHMKNNEYSDALLRLRREKQRERRRRQWDAFFENIGAQNADKVIFLFDNDLNIA